MRKIKAYRALLIITMVYLLFTFFLFPTKSPEKNANQTKQTQEPDPAMIKDIVYKWNTAISSHNVDALSSLYAGEVSFYGETITREDTLSAKREFFQKHPSFTQSIVGDVEIGKGDNVASFTKRVVIEGKAKDIPSYLVIDEIEPWKDALDFGFKSNNQEENSEKLWRIIVESDEITDANLLNQKTSFNVKEFKACEDVVMGIFKSSEEVREDITPTVIMDITERSDFDGVYTLHLYHFFPLSPFRMTAGWYEFNTHAKVLMKTVSEYRELEYDKKLLPYLDKFCK